MTWRSLTWMPWMRLRQPRCRPPPRSLPPRTTCAICAQQQRNGQQQPPLPPPQLLAMAAEAALDLSVPAQFLRLRLLAVRDCDAGAALITATGPPAYLEMLRKHAASVDMAFDGVSVRPLHKTTLSAAVVGGAKKGAAGFFKKPAAAAAAPAGEARVITEAGAPLALGTEEAVFAALHLPAVEPTARAAAAAAAASTAAAAAATVPSAAAAAAGE